MNILTIIVKYKRVKAGISFIQLNWYEKIKEGREKRFLIRLIKIKNKMINFPSCIKNKENKRIKFKSIV